jgi:predicted MFS family arabinose efflux permease
MTQMLSQAEEWRKYWPLVLAAFLGVSVPSIAVISIGLFVGPLEKEFGWSRTEISAGISLAALMTIPLSPLIGALIDRWGGRRLALPGLLLTSLAIASLSLANGSFVQWMLLWALYGLAAMLIKITLWTAAIAGTFHAGRSMALSLTLSGSAMVVIVIPPLTEWLIGSFGWRMAYIGLAAAFGIPALVMSYISLYDARDRARVARASAPSDLPPPEPARLQGLSVAEALRCFALYRIAGATLITLLLSAAFMVHQFPILTESGVSRQNAAMLASLAGVASIVGKLVTGWLMERYDGGVIGCITNLVLALAMLLLMEPFRTSSTIVLAMIIIGYSNGTKLQICVYLTSIYAGMLNYGKIFGVMASVIAVAGGIGPLVGGMIYDLSGEYDLLIFAGIPTSVIAGLLLLRLGPYPGWAPSRAARRPEAAPA